MVGITREVSSSPVLPIIVSTQKRATARLKTGFTAPFLKPQRLPF